MNGILQTVEPFARGATSILVNALWEDVVIAALVALLLCAWPRLNAATRYALWFVALIASIAVPVLSTFSPAQSAVSATVATAPHHRAGVVRTSAIVTSAVVATGHATAAKEVASQPSGAPAKFRLPAFAAPRIVVPTPAADAVLALWIVALALFLAQLALGLARLERLKKNALPLPLEHRDALARLASAPRGGRDVRICVSDEVSVPVAVGLFDSMILVPRHLLDSLTHEDVEHVCLHEMAHLRRADDWTNLLQRLVTAFAWFSPAVYAIARGLDLEREVACDDDVVATMGAVRPYARCLTKMAEITAWPHHALAAPGVFVTRRGISERIERLLRAGRNAARGLSLGPTALAIAAIAFLTLGMRTVAPIAAAPLTPAPIATLAPVSTLTPMATLAPVATPKAAHVPAAGVRVRAAHAAFPATHVHVPATYVHVPAVNVHVPAIDVNVPGVDVHVPAIDVNVPEAYAWRHAYSGAHGCAGCDFSDADWSGRDLHGRSYDGADFSNGRFVRTNFAQARLRGADFSDADLRSANFDGAQLTGCDFSNADVRGAAFHGADVQGCGFSDAHLDVSQAHDILSSCGGCDMSNANLSGADLSGLALTGDDFSGSNLSHADFRGARLTRVDLSDADLSGARFAGATLIGCDLSGVDRSRVDLSQAHLVSVPLARHEQRKR